MRSVKALKERKLARSMGALKLQPAVRKPQARCSRATDDCHRRYVAFSQSILTPASTHESLNRQSAMQIAMPAPVSHRA